MSIQSKSARILAVVSGLALAPACSEVAEQGEVAEQQEAPEAMRKQEADAYVYCNDCAYDFWGVGANGVATGWVCLTTQPQPMTFEVGIEKWNGSTWQQIGSGNADKYYSALTPYCAGSPYHQFNINVGSWNAGPGQYRMFARYTLITDTLYAFDYVTQ